MKYFVKINGELVECTLDQFLDKSIQLFDAEGKEVDRPAAEKAVEKEVPAPAVDFSALTETLNKLNGAVEGFAAKQIETEKELKDLKVKAQKGFALQNPDEVIKHTDSEDEALDFVGKHYDLNRQGKTFKSFMLPGSQSVYAPEKDALKEMTKFFGLVTIGSKRHPDSDSMKAMDMIKKIYGSVEGKTVIGDSGNVFPIPDIVESEILWFARERSIALQQARMVDMTSAKQSWPRETASATVSWGNTTSESDPTVDEVELDATELSCWSGVRNTHLADSRSDIVAWLTANLGEAAGLELDNKMFNGLGTDSPFICSGLLSAACGYSVTMAAGSTAFSQLTSTHLSAMIAALDGVKKAGGRFFMNGAVLHFVRDLKDTNGRPIFMDGNIGAGIPATIFGYPYTESIKMVSTTAANTAFMSFGNLQHFLVGRRLQSGVLDVDPYGLWTTNRTRYKIYQRWALEMALPNAFVRLLTHS